MKEQLIETWQISNRVDLLLLDHLTPEGLLVSLSTRGRNVYEQLVHLHTVRLQWLDVMGQKTAALPSPGKSAPPDINTLRTILGSSSKAIEELISASWENGGRLKGFKRGIIPFIGYLIAHEAHHRGNILLTLKQSSIKLPDALKWGIWDWNKV
jgi:uncharacterized damage-inducible protein DinB